MIDALKFVQGAVQRNGISPELEHFQIKNGRVVGFNGYMALSAPIDLSIEAMPKAVMFHKALQACGDTIAIDQTPAGRLHIKSGGFSAYIPCIDKEVFEATPMGELFPAPANLASIFARMLPLIGDDASRPWAMGLAVGDGTYTATNNVIVLQIWDGHTLPTFNCPRFAVAEIARIKEDPVSIQLDPGSSVTFHFADGRWLRTQLLTQEWPAAKMNSIMDKPSSPHPFPDGFFAAVNKLVPFVEDKTSAIYFTADGVSTGVAGAEEGAMVTLAGLPKAAFRLKALLMLEHEIQTIDLSTHPNPCLFFGPNSRGALIGLSF